MQYTELITYFKDRFTELFHKDSLDSYRVRYHNTLSILKELRNLIEGWQDKNIKRAETLLYCITEVIGIIDQDDVFDFSICSKSRFADILNEFSKELKDINSKKDRQPSLKGTHLIYLLNKYISLNQDKYLNLLWDKIEGILFKPGDFPDKELVPNLDKLDKVICSLAREILNRGYSKSAVFFWSQKYLKENNSTEAFKEFKKLLSASALKEYTVILQLYILDAPDSAFTDFHSEVQPSVLNEFRRKDPSYLRFIAKAQNRRFFIAKSKVTDAQSAIRYAKIKLYGELDAIHIGISQMSVSIFQKAIVIEHRPTDEDYVTMYPTQFVLDGTFPQDIATSNKYRVLLRNIKNNLTIDDSVKIRLDGALRHLRIANADNEIEQRFINYWIALEFIFSSPLIEENTYLRLKINLTNILSACYVARNLQNIESILKTKGLLDKDDMLDETNVDTIIDKTSGLLIKYRLMKFKARLFGHKDKRKDYLQNHRNNLEAHLSRIYHLRNELIHEAGINQDIEDLTSNLKYYLTFLLNQMIIYFSSLPNSGNRTNIKIDEFFYEYQMIIDNIKEDWAIDKMRKVPYHNELIS
ncbi:MAG: hypothetical protein K2L45_11770 [Muribaculaceae bacterium]|nr:hypothetical protein [Muribaculaceae bacterium]